MLLLGSVALAWSLQSERTDKDLNEILLCNSSLGLPTNMTIPPGAKVQKRKSGSKLNLYHCPKAVACRTLPFTFMLPCFSWHASIRPLAPSDPQVWSAHPAISPLARSRSALVPRFRGSVARLAPVVPAPVCLGFLNSNGRPIAYSADWE